MKLGTETGSLINHLQSRMKNPEPELGMGATMFSWTDRNPGTVVEIIQRNGYQIIGIQADDYTRTDNNGFGSEAQEYIYTPNTSAHISYYCNRKGSWKSCYRNEDTGRWVTSGGSGGIGLGRREKYHDFCF